MKRLIRYIVISILGTLSLTGCSFFSDIETILSGNYEISINNKEELEREWYFTNVFYGDYYSYSDIENYRPVSLSIKPNRDLRYEFYHNNLNIESSNSNVAYGGFCDYSEYSGPCLFASGEGTATITFRYHDSVDYVNVTIKNPNSNKTKYGTEHEGTEEDPYSVEDTINVATSWRYQRESCYIEGIIDSFYYPSGNQGDGYTSFYLRSYNDYTITLFVNRCYDRNGYYLSTNDISVNDRVVLQGSLIYQNDMVYMSNAYLVKTIY